MIFFISR